MDTPDLSELDAAIAAVPRRCRRIFLLSRTEGLDCEAIAERLGISRDAVERDLAHALCLLDRRLGRRGAWRLVPMWLR